MKRPKIKAHIYTNGSFVHHVSANGRVGDRPGHRCTSGCRRVWHWRYVITVNGKEFAADGTGSWRPLFDQAFRELIALKLIAGQVTHSYARRVDIAA